MPSFYDECFCTFTEKRPAGTRMNYIGNGIFKCPTCGATHDHHDIIFRMRLRFEKKNGYTHIAIHKPYDSRLRKIDTDRYEDKDDMCHCHGREPHRHTLLHSIKDDMDSGERIECMDYMPTKDHPLGDFDCDVMYSWEDGETDCGTEWDLDFKIIAETRVN
ncbi:Uncharacterised protein [uncultured archaeon]|nr:Uncharacterised protein [uncultured archaeon]